MNLTLAVDEALVERARAVAREQGTSLNALIREYIEQLAGQVTGDELLAELEQLWSEPGDSRGTISANTRESLYSDRLRRYKSR
jgi:hypothetical protein